jgi:glyoxylase-like metal-dependent hydrolase (beta-lactamase superfamily II)
MSSDQGPGLHVLPITAEYGGRELTINPAVIESDRGLILVDVGPTGAVDGIRTHLRGLGFDLDDIWLVVVTHHDGDHVDGLADLLERIDPVVAAHREEAPFLTGERDLIKGTGEAFQPVSVDIELVDGVRLPTLVGPMTVVETPGHSPGHVSLYVDDHDLLIAGDALVADGEAPLSGPKPEFTPEMDRAVETVGRLAELPIEHTLCYHGGYVEAGSDRIAEIHRGLQ